jgi:hypothetical protein
MHDLLVVLFAVVVTGIVLLVIMSTPRMRRLSAWRWPRSRRRRRAPGYARRARHRRAA